MPLKGGGGIRWDRGKASHLKEREIINWLQHPPVLSLFFMKLWSYQQQDCVLMGNQHGSSGASQ